MKLYNVVVMFDVYVVAGSNDTAEGAVIEMIHEDKPKPSSIAALQLVTSKVRPSWEGEKPIVAGDVNDDDYTSIKGKTALQVYNMLYRREDKAR